MPAPSDEAEDFVAVDRIAAFGQFVVELSDLFVDDECVAAALGRNFSALRRFSDSMAAAAARRSSSASPDRWA